VTPQHFAQHLEVLQKYAHPISLKQLAIAHQNGNIPQRAVAITFDDGYVDNLYQAKPLLERYNIPATVFVSTGYMGQQREFWWDELERLLLRPGRLPDKLCLDINGNLQRWELGLAVNYSEEDRECDRHISPWQAEPGSRLFFYYSLWQQLKPLPESQQLKALQQITQWANVDSVTRPNYRPLLLEEIRTLEQGGLVEVGAHTVTHPSLKAHTPSFQMQEIQQSKADLEKLLGHPVTSFAYPFGDYAAETVELMHQTGFVYACSTVKDTVWRQSDCFQLPRFGVYNWNGEEFAKQLLRCFRS
ncbi:MAG TPA: polysaccharide deacetylase family protein, partial [Coleofasciculaceae cyanobacterium]